MTVLGRDIPKLPLAFAGIGAAYYLTTLAQRPSHPDPRWDRHIRDAKFALLAGLGAGAALWGLESWR
ncbi:MAG TPA: hypothetical protein VFA98_12805 [Thermoanaerobaculia bacterium]|jgi:hypothetical protein|nr:hypothetical protein [Thermoanaerobaculia bacterium]